MTGDARLGTTVGGAVLERLLGRGGMGAVYLGRRAQAAPVVVKLLAPELARNPALRLRFLREGEALRRVRPHPHVVRVFAVLDADEPALLMELVDGPSLAQLLAQRGRLPAAEAARLVRETALGLAALHALGLVHRDVKPANVLVTAGGRAKVVDLGLAKDAFASGLTEPGALMGTVEYMAPEQWAGEPVCPRTDVYALGATLYALLCGRPPLQGDDLAELADRAAAGEVDPPRSLAPDVPVELERVVLRALEPERDWRYPSAEALADDLERVARGGPASVPALVGAGGAPRLPLLPGRTFVLGRAGDLFVDHPSVAPKHAQIRRKERGFVVTDLRAPAGTFVGGERLTAPRTLAAGDRLRLGEVELAFEPARDDGGGPSWLRDAARRLVPAPVVQALASAGDPRALAWTLERLAPDPLAAARARRALESLGLGGPALEAVLARRDALLAGARDRLPAALARQAGQAPPDPERPGAPEPWLAWWDAARTSAPEQLGPEGCPPGLRLRVVAPAPGPAVELAGAPDVLLLGRDPRCALALDDPTVSRRHAAVYRLHGRLVARNDDPGLGTLHRGGPLDVAFLDPGDVLTLGAVEVALEADPRASAPPALGPGRVGVDLLTLAALEEAGQPAAAAALVVLFDLPAVARWAERWAEALAAGADPRPLAQALAAPQHERAARVRGGLATLLRLDPALDPRQALARAQALGPQAWVPGWPEP